MSASATQRLATFVSRSAPYWRAGLAAGGIAVLLNLLIYIIMIVGAGHTWLFVIVISIAVASLLPNLLAAVAYFGLSQFTRHARLLVTVGVILFVLTSVLPHLGVGPAPSPALAALPEGFDRLTVPLHVIFGATAIFLMPPFVKRFQQSS